jgi:hypothetical protein
MWGCHRRGLSSGVFDRENPALHWKAQAGGCLLRTINRFRLTMESGKSGKQLSEGSRIALQIREEVWKIVTPPPIPEKRTFWGRKNKLKSFYM